MPPRKAPARAQDRRFDEVVDRVTKGYKTRGQTVYAVLRTAILSGALSPGERLRQAALAEAIGVSRISVRTVLLRLEFEGLVHFHPGRGASVCSLNDPRNKSAV
jgi:DNA-binding GntR family transcriptional regulator